MEWSSLSGFGRILRWTVEWFGSIPSVRSNRRRIRRLSGLNRGGVDMILGAVLIPKELFEIGEDAVDMMQ